MNEEKKTFNFQDKKVKLGVLIALLSIIGIWFVSCVSKESITDVKHADNSLETVETSSETEMEGSLTFNETPIENQEEIDTSVVEETTELVTQIEQIEEEKADMISVTTVETEIVTESKTVVTPESVEEHEEEEELTTPQRNAVNMMNYITVLTQKINNSSNDRIYLDSVHTTLYNNLNYNAVDHTTQKKINDLWNTIQSYKMIDVKRDRLDYIYEQNKAQALRSAVPDPVSLLSAVESKTNFKKLASVIYMAIDSEASYKAAKADIELNHLKENWDLDDEESGELSSSQLNLLNYMMDMARDNGIPTKSTLNPKAVTEFADWSDEPNIVRKISWLEQNKETYKEFSTYWLELAKSYYTSAIKNNDKADYKKCLSAMEQYGEVATRIFREDWDYAETIPMAIIAAKETMDEEDYVEYADKYVKEIGKNGRNENWTLKFFEAETYIDLYNITGEMDYLNKAYEIARNNVNMLVGKQMELNKKYIEDVEKAKVGENYSKRQKKEVKEYNKMLDEKRKVELPPVNDAFYMNLDLLYALADEKNILRNEMVNIDKIVHGEEMNMDVFLTKTLDNQYWVSKEVDKINSNNIEVEFSGDKIVIPASCITERYEIKATVSGGTVLDDWTVKEVKRPKDSQNISEFMVTLTSEKGNEYEYIAGEKITVRVSPIKPEEGQVVETLDFNYEVKERKTLGVINGIEIEREK